MELLRGTAPKVKFYGPTPETEINNVTYSVNGAVPILTTFSESNGEGEVQLPYLDASANNVEVTWSFNIGETFPEPFYETFSYEAVTPLLTKQEIQKILDDDTATDEDIWEVESAVRNVIQAHTGQKFGFDANKTLVVAGRGDGALRLPERIVNLSGLSTQSNILDPHSVIILSDGWYLKKRWADSIGERTTDDLYFGEDSRPGGVIYAPSVTGSASNWRDDYPFEITGDWGYKTVPVAVKEAAKLLLNDYACSEAIYRDRYLESIKSADWRLQFSSRAWESTGNARADHLLTDFVIWDWLVI